MKSVHHNSLYTGNQMDVEREGDPRTHADETWTKKIQDNGMNWRQAAARRLVYGVYAPLRVKRLKTCVHGRHLV